MKRKLTMKYVFFTLFILSILLNVYSGYKIKKHKESGTPTHNTLSHNMRINEILNNNKLLDREQKLVNIEGDTVSLGSVFKGGPKLVIRYSVLNCQVCVDEEMIRLKKLGERIGNENIVILTYYQRFRDVIVFHKKTKNPFPVYFIPDNNLKLPVEEENIPYLFVSDEDCLAKMFFIPEKTMPEISNIYYEQVADRYFSNNELTAISYKQEK